MEKYVKIKMNRKRPKVISYISNEYRYNSEALNLRGNELLVEVESFITMPDESYNEYTRLLKDELMKVMNIRRYPIYRVDMGFTTVINDDYRTSCTTKMMIFKDKMSSQDIVEFKKSFHSNDEFNIDYINIVLVEYETWCMNNGTEFTTINIDQSDEALIASCNEYMSRNGINISGTPTITRDDRIIKLKY